MDRGFGAIVIAVTMVIWAVVAVVLVLELAERYAAQMGPIGF